LPNKWALRGDSAIHFKEWQDEFVVFDERSAATHLLGWAAGAVLQALIDTNAAMSVPELLVALDLREHDQEFDRQEVEALGAILDELERIELIEAMPS